MYYNIGLDEEDNKWYQVQTEQEQKQEPQLTGCYLCGAQTNNQQPTETIKRSIKKICDDCELIKSHSPKSDAIVLRNTQYQHITVVKGEQFIPYDMIKEQCPICHQNVILYMIGKCNHYACFECLQTYLNANNIICPIENCLNKLDDYLSCVILDEIQLETSKIFKPFMFCPRYKCTTTLSIKPYEDLSSVSVIYNSQKIKCTSCKKEYCQKCRTIHKGTCNEEKIYQECKEALKIAACPVCNVDGMAQACGQSVGICVQIYTLTRQFQTNYQLCMICNHIYCFDCKRNIQLFDANDTVGGYCCRHCKANYNNLFSYSKRCIRNTPFHLVLSFVFYLALVGIVICLTFGALLLFVFFMAVKQLNQVIVAVVNTTSKYLKKQNQLLVIILSPIIIPIIFTIIVVGYVVSFVPLMIFNIRNILQ